MKVITWNCHKGGLEEKFKYIRRFKPDVLIVQEADSVDLPGATGRDWVPPTNKTGKHGLGIYTFNEYSLRKTGNGSNSWGIYLPVKVYRGSEYVCNVVGYWTKPKKLNSKDYMSGFVDFFKTHTKLIKSKPTVAAGDLNCLGGLSSFAQVMAITEELSLVSAYYEYNGMRVGGESRSVEASYFEDWKRTKDKKGKPYLLDHVFIPLIWRRRLKDVRIVQNIFERSAGRKKKLSDHRPVIVNIDLDIDVTKESWQK